MGYSGGGKNPLTARNYSKSERLGFAPIFAQIKQSGGTRGLLRMTQLFLCMEKSRRLCIKQVIFLKGLVAAPRKTWKKSPFKRSRRCFRFSEKGEKLLTVRNKIVTLEMTQPEKKDAHRETRQTELLLISCLLSPQSIIVSSHKTEFGESQS